LEHWLQVGIGRKIDGGKGDIAKKTGPRALKENNEKNKEVHQPKIIFMMIGFSHYARPSMF